MKQKEQQSKPNKGFTLLELMIVVAVIALIVSMVIPAFMRVKENAQNGRLLNNWRNFAAGVEQYAMFNGDYPEEVGAGVLPVGMDDFISLSRWSDQTVVGGNWDYDYGTSFLAGISLADSNVKDRQMTRLDQQIDDGDLNSGLFQKTGSNKFTLIIEM